MIVAIVLAVAALVIGLLVGRSMGKKSGLSDTPPAVVEDDDVVIDDDSSPLEEIASLRKQLTERNTTVNSLIEALDANQERMDAMAGKFGTLNFINSLASSPVSAGSDVVLQREKTGMQIAGIIRDELRTLFQENDFMDERAGWYLGSGLDSWLSRLSAPQAAGSNTVAFVGSFASGKGLIVNKLLKGSIGDATLYPESPDAGPTVPIYLLHGDKLSCRISTPDGVLKDVSDEVFMSAGKSGAWGMAGLGSIARHVAVICPASALENFNVVDTPLLSGDTTEDAGPLELAVRRGDAICWAFSVSDILSSHVAEHRCFPFVKDNFSGPICAVLTCSGNDSDDDKTEAQKLLHRAFESCGISLSGLVLLDENGSAEPLVKLLSGMHFDNRSANYLPMLEDECIRPIISGCYSKVSEIRESLANAGKDMSRINGEVNQICQKINENSSAAVNMPQLASRLILDNFYKMSESAYSDFASKMNQNSHCTDMIRQRVSSIRSLLNKNLSQVEILNIAFGIWQQFKSCDERLQKLAGKL